jgi:predicted nucleic acid-binding protein
MPLVIDTSSVMAWLMPDETGVDLLVLLAAHDDITVPWLFWIEVRNALLMAERRKRLSAAGIEELVQKLDDLGLAMDTTPNSSHLFALARTYGLSAYDALYLELALRRKATLATSDVKLALAARAAGVMVA